MENKKIKIAFAKALSTKDFEHAYGPYESYEIEEKVKVSFENWPNLLCVKEIDESELPFIIESINETNRKNSVYKMIAIKVSQTIQDDVAQIIENSEKIKAKFLANQEKNQKELEKQKKRKEALEKSKKEKELKRLQIKMEKLAKEIKT